MYVAKDLVGILIYRITLEYIQVINLANVMYVVKDLVGILTYRHTLEYILIINLNNMIYIYMLAAISEIRH
jgi:hypothetical protein